jgi:hypothetical protein
MKRQQRTGAASRYALDGAGRGEVSKVFDAACLPPSPRSWPADDQARAERAVQARPRYGVD